MSYKPQPTRLIDCLDQKSLDVLRHFGHIFTDPKTGRRYIRVFKHPKVISVWPRRAGKNTLMKVLHQQLNGQPNRSNQQPGRSRQQEPARAQA